MTHAEVAIAVVSWNTRELLHVCLSSLAAEVRCGRAEVWVVDNGSGDGSPEMVRSRFPWAGLIEPHANIGFGPAVNLVAERTASTWLACANADVALSDGALAGLLGAGAADSSAGILAPQLVRAHGTIEHSVHPFPGLGTTLAFNLGLAAVFAGLGDRLALEGHWDSTRRRQVDWALGAFLLIRRTCFDGVGGFDPEMWMYAEDLDLGWRAARAGWHTLYEPSAIVRHHGAAATAQAWGDERTARWMLSTYAWMLRRRGPAAMRAYALINLGGAIARAGLASVPGARTQGGRRTRVAEMTGWAKVHLRALLTPAEVLRRHR
ncbi:MAG: glycosyltransferase family 2 protein [Solirubrobacteraceae bacterium]